MPVNPQQYASLQATCREHGATLVAVSKTKPAEEIRELFDLGQRDFGENYVQELVEKQAALPVEIRWHFIGHLQSNKVKYIAGFVHLVHGVDSLKLLREINRQAEKQGRVIDVLLQMHIASEETKFGLDENELHDLVAATSFGEMKHVRVRGLMGMASFSENGDLLRSEFRTLKRHFDWLKQAVGAPHRVDILSMGMSGDYSIALEEGSNMVRIGSLLFGERRQL